MASFFCYIKKGFSDKSHAIPSLEMKSSLFLFIGLFTLKVSSFQCPPGSYEVPNENVCILLVAKTEFYTDVIHRCRDMGGLPAKIQNIYENSLIYTMLPTIDADLAPYIGIERKTGNVWAYDDGTSLIYQNWAFNEPDMSSNTSLCAIMDPQNGKWHSSECSFARPYACTISGNSMNSSTYPQVKTTANPVRSCPSGWVYFDKSCYYVQNFTFSGTHWQLYTFKNAEKSCVAMGAHLVSIHSKQEEDFVYNLITSYVKDQKKADKYGDPCDYGLWAWNGLYGNGATGSGSWTDKSPVDYPATRQIDSYFYWTMCNDPSCNCQRWDWNVGGSDQTFPRYVCKMPSNGESERAS